MATEWAREVTGLPVINPGTPIRLKPAIFKRVPFDRLPPWRTLGTVRRVIGREPGRTLVEIEVDGYIGIAWDFELKRLTD